VEFEQHLKLLKEAVSKFSFAADSPPYFCSIYLEEYDDYVLLCFTESTSPQSPDCFYVDWLVYNVSNDSHLLERKEGQRIEVTKGRFNLDFGLSFLMLNPDEKNFFYQAYSKVVTVRRLERGDSVVTYTAFLKDFTVEVTKYGTVGSTFKMPLKLKLLSNQQQPIAVTVSTFNENIVQMVGAVLAVNPRSFD
jgi:hypothetical protein